MVHQYFEVLESDRQFYNRYLAHRLPERIVDSHVHIALPEHIKGIDAEVLKNDWAMQCATHMSEEQLLRYSKQLFPDAKFEYIALPMPIKGADLAANNQYISNIRTRGLMATLPDWDIEYCENTLLTGGFSGFKPYPNLVSTVKGAEIPIFDFITHEQFALLNKHKKAVLLHLPRAGRLPDEDNIRELREIRQKYSDLKIVLAHFGRCFTVGSFVDGIKKLAGDLDGFYFDTAAVINPQVYQAAFDSVSSERILFGTDMPILLWHGKRTWNNGTYQNLCKEDFPWNNHTEGREAESKYTFFIYEQLKSILDTIGYDETVKRRVFIDNAEKVYAPTQSQDTLGGRRVTLKDVAEKSGYSLRTVKKVLGGREYVSESVKSQVIAASKELGYQRNKIASALAKNRIYKIAVVYTETSKYFFPDVKKGFEACVKDYRDFGIAVEFFVDKGSKSDISILQLNLLQELHLRADIDGVVIHPFVSEKLAHAIDELMLVGKPVVTFGTDVPESKRLCYVGPDGEKSGRIAAQIMGNYIGKCGRVSVLSFVSGHQQTKFRETGFINKIHESFPKVEIIKHEFNGLLSDDEYYCFVRRLLNKDEIAGIFATSANVYIVGQVIKELNKNDVVVIGYDLSDETKQLLRDDYIKVIMFQNPKMQAYNSMKLICDYFLEGKKPKSERIYTDVSVLTGECI